MSKPAILGGKPIKAAIGDYIRWPVPDAATRDSLLAAFDSGIWGMGPMARRFSEEFAAYCGAAYGLPVTSGTKALELSFRALNIGRGDEVILPAYTFVASASAIAECGALPVFADIDPDTYTLSAADAERRITPRTRAILCVHVGGRPCDMDALAEVAQRHGVPLVEDAAQAHGSAWRGRPVGSIGVCGCFSFQASKNLSCGEGGFVTAGDKALYELLWSLHNAGRAFGDDSLFHPNLGANARMTEFQAAVLLAQMARLEPDKARRMENAAYLDARLGEFPFLEPLRHDERVTANSYHLYIFRYKRERLKGLSRGRFVEALRAENVCEISEGYSRPIYDMDWLYAPAFEKITGRTFENPASTLPHAEPAAREQGLWMTHASLLGGREDMDAIVEAISRIADHADELISRS